MSAKNKSAKSPRLNKFIWNELVAKNETVAKNFYSGLFGWKAEPFGKGMPYTLFKQGKDGVGGMMKCPSPDNASGWLPYVTVADVDKTVIKAKKLGAKIAVEAFDVKTVGRIAVLVDPQGAAIGIITTMM
jgi:predicted enzyme related to lactoylglutathione lyase